MDANQLARHLGVNRAWVYEHAHELGAVTLGDGPRPRLRFDPRVAAQALQARHLPTTAPRAAADAPQPGRPHRRRPAGVPLLPVHEPTTRTRQIMSRFALPRRRRS